MMRCGADVFMNTGNFGLCLLAKTEKGSLFKCRGWWGNFGRSWQYFFCKCAEFKFEENAAQVVIIRFTPKQFLLVELKRYI